MIEAYCSNNQTWINWLKNRWGTQSLQIAPNQALRRAVASEAEAAGLRRMIASGGSPSLAGS
jgi:hypothetical protein